MKIFCEINIHPLENSPNTGVLDMRVQWLDNALKNEGEKVVQTIEL